MISRHARIIPLIAFVLLALAAPSAAQRSEAAARPAVDPALFGGLRYRMIGPSRGGRVTTVTGVPSQPFTFYQGSTGGGVWKTVNAGVTLTNVSDAFFGEASMGSVEVALSDPNVVWAGTGSEGIRSNVSTGRGVYRSTDAGATWRWMGLQGAGQIGAVRIHPADPRTVFVAAVGNAFRPNRERGVYRSADGGTTWRKLAGGLPQGLFGKSNLAVSAADPRRVYALIEAAPGGGLYRSDDAGESWAL